METRSEFISSYTNSMNVYFKSLKDHITKIATYIHKLSDDVLSIDFIYEDGIYVIIEVCVENLEDLYNIIVTDDKLGSLIGWGYIKHGVCGKTGVITIQILNL